MITIAAGWPAKQLRTSASQRTLNQHHLNRNRKFVDSPLEGDGFEPSVPRSPVSSVGAACRSCRRGSGSGSAMLFPRLEPLRRAGLGHGLSRLWLAALRGGFRHLAVQLIYTFALHRLDQQFAERPDQGINAVR